MQCSATVTNSIPFTSKEQRDKETAWYTSTKEPLRAPLTVTLERSGWCPEQLNWMCAAVTSGVGIVG